MSNDMDSFVDVDETEEQREKKKNEKSKEQEEKEDTIFEMSTKAGRRNVFRLLAEARIYSSTFTGNSHTYYLEGKRDVGLWKMQKIMKYCPKQYIIMLEENYAREVKETEVKNNGR